MSASTPCRNLTQNELFKMRIEDYARKRFANGPVGAWCSTDSSPFGQFAIEFDSDGTGQIEFSAMESLQEGPQLESHDFVWCAVGERRIEITCELLNGDSDDRVVEYDFRTEIGDYGVHSLPLTETALAPAPNTLFYFCPPCLACNPPSGTEDELEAMLVSIEPENLQ